MPRQALAAVLLLACAASSCRAAPGQPRPHAPPSIGSPSIAPSAAAPAPPASAQAPSTAAPAPSPDAIALPGRCEAIPQLSWVAYVSSQQASPRDSEHASGDDGPARRLLRTHATVDVDGDGIRDVLVPVPGPRDCPDAAPRDLYVVRGSCGHRVGSVIGDVSIGGAPTPRRPGLAELTTTTTYGEQGDPREPAVRRTDRRTYRFEGGIYREVARSSDTGVCHHCSTTSCVVQPE